MAKWIWYPYDYEYYLYKKTCVNRYFYKDVVITPYWRIDSPAPNVEFSKEFTLSADTKIKIRADGVFSVVVDQKIITRFSGEIELEKGKHSLSVRVYNEHGLPCVYVDGGEVASDESFTVTSFDGDALNAACGEFTDIEVSPNAFISPMIEREWKSVEITKDGILYDAGETVVGAIEVESASENVACYYGETRDEALDYNHSDVREFKSSKIGERVKMSGQGFRYVLVVGGSAKLLVEEMPFNMRAKFSCQDKLLENAFNVAVNTLRLNSREFILDGTKRDRWVWAGDAFIASFFTFYTTFDKDVIKRTISVLKARTPNVNSHINNVVDYTLLWVMAIKNYYDYTGDKKFVLDMYPFIKAYLDFCIKIADDDGFLRQRQGEMVFVDHCDLDREKINSYVQVLFVAALNAADELCFEIYGKKGAYGEFALKLTKSIYQNFYDADKGTLCYYKLSDEREYALYGDIIAVLYDVGESDKLCRIKQYLCANGKTALGTPYAECLMAFALSKCNRFDLVYDKLSSCWGYMLDKGAQTFWESNLKQGAGDYALYGRKYGKSLCHAWSAGPIAIIMRELLGLRPQRDGTFTITPQIEYLSNCDLTVPVRDGYINVKITPSEIYVKSEGVSGEVVLVKELFGKESRYAVMNGQERVIQI